MSSIRTCLVVVLTATGIPLAPSLRAAPTSDLVLAAEDGIGVDQPWARASAGAATTGAAYVTLMGGSRPDTLVSVSTPVAATAEVHETINENSVMKMRPVPALQIPSGKAVTFEPGGTHIMLMGLKHPLTVGQSFPLTLTFAHAAPVTVEVRVRGIGGASGPPMGAHDQTQ
jgi:copper(I)-binding protein